MKEKMQNLVNKKRINELVIVRNLIDLLVEIGNEENLKGCFFEYNDADLGIHVDIKF